MSRPNVQTTLYSLDRHQSLTASHVADDRDSVEKTEKSDNEAQSHLPSADVEQDDGVTRIEALCKLDTRYRLLTTRPRLWEGAWTLCSLGFDWSDCLCVLAKSKHYSLLYVHVLLSY